MNNGYGWIEFAFFGPLVLGLALWQLWSVNREIARDKEKSAGSARHPVGEHPLDDGRDEPRQ
jgi:hypothetical protein